MASRTLPHRVVRSRGSRPRSQSVTRAPTWPLGTSRKSRGGTGGVRRNPARRRAPARSSSRTPAPHASEAPCAYRGAAATGSGPASAVGHTHPDQGLDGPRRESRGPWAGQRPGSPPGPATHELPGQSLPGAESSPSSPHAPPGTSHLSPPLRASSARALRRGFSPLTHVSRPPSRGGVTTPRSEWPKPRHFPWGRSPPLPRHGTTGSHGAEGSHMFSKRRPCLPGTAVTTGLRATGSLPSGGQRPPSVQAKLRGLWGGTLPASPRSWGSSLLSLLCGPVAPVCPSLIFLRGHQSCWIRAHPSDLVFIHLHPQRPCFQLRSRSQASGVRIGANTLGAQVKPRSVPSASPRLRRNH